MGLNSNYDKVRGTILMMKPLPSIGQAYALLVQDKKQREIHSSTQFVSESAAMNVSDTNRFQNNKSVVCPNCNKVGHLANKCYRIIGFPKDTKFTKNKKFAANVCAESHGSGDDVSKSTSPNQILTPAQYKEFISLLQKFANINDNAPTTNAINYANFAPSLKRPVVLGKLLNGLYHLHINKDVSPSHVFSNSVFSCNSVVTSDVWHSRLGHLPFYKLK
ncbi:putative transcription factor interactor and regulator CCHC(Zn) family [Helianthus annuus]|uniref:Transcription factor interactor and regulator CCHC(Zn) family n=1 Tax=Helianthus annuus TaxID=4232 RepID=A0A9K3DTJ8_HELAN|nr:putative transcription factor interactor and regulator CCHC(Zn) family [Helianthus annuus]